MDVKDWLAIAVSALSLGLTALFGFWQRRQSHRLDNLSMAFKADVELYQGVRHAALASHRSTIEKKLAQIQDAIVKTQHLKDAISYLLEAAQYPDTIPRASAVLELEAAVDGVEEAHRALTQWFSLAEMLPLHACKSASAPLSALASTQLEGTERILRVPDDLKSALQHSRDLAAAAQGQLRLLAESHQYFLRDSRDHAPRLMDR